MTTAKHESSLTTLDRLRNGLDSPLGKAAVAGGTLSLVFSLGYNRPHNTDPRPVDTSNLVEACVINDGPDRGEIITTTLSDYHHRLAAGTLAAVDAPACSIESDESSEKVVVICRMDGTKVLVTVTQAERDIASGLATTNLLDCPDIPTPDIDSLTR